jgi:hypothetical protein
MFHFKCFLNFLKKRVWVCSLVVEYLPGMCKALGSIPEPQKQRKIHTKKRRRRRRRNLISFDSI